MIMVQAWIAVALLVIVSIYLGLALFTGTGHWGADADD